MVDLQSPAIKTCDRLGPTLLQQVQAAKLLTQIGECLVGANDLPRALAGCAEALARHFGAAGARLWVRRGDWLDLVAASGPLSDFDSALSRIKVGATIIGLVAQSRQPFSSAQTPAGPQPMGKGEPGCVSAPRAWAQTADAPALIAYPLLADDELLGVVALNGRQPFAQETFNALSFPTRLIARGILRIRPVQIGLENSPIAISESNSMYFEHAVITKTLDDIIVDWNPGARQLLGYDKHEVLGLPCARLISAESQADHGDALERLRRGEETSLSEATLLHLDGRHIEVGLTQFPLRDQAGNLFASVLVAHDLADFQRLQQRSRWAEITDDLGQSARMISHELNNLWTAIMAHSSFLKDPHQSPDEARLHLDILHQSAVRGAALSKQIEALADPTRRLYFPPLPPGEEQGVREHRAEGQGVRDHRPEPPPIQAHTSLGADPNALPTGNETILLVDDEDNLRACLRRILEGLGYTVLEAADGQAAMDMLQCLDRRIDLIVADVMMPNMGARGLADALQALRCEVKLLFTSGFSADVLADNGIHAHDASFLPKPHTRVTLAQKVRELLDSPRDRASSPEGRETI